MAYVKVTNGVPEIYSIGKLRRDNPNTSFPKQIPAEVLESFGLYEVFEQPQPSHDEEAQTVLRSNTPVLEGGKWVLNWQIVDKTQEELSAQVRQKRDLDLSQSDWVVTKATEVGGVVPSGWATYRQALRDIPDQAGFPDVVTWPTKPE